MVINKHFSSSCHWDKCKNNCVSTTEFLNKSPALSKCLCVQTCSDMNKHVQTFQLVSGADFSGCFAQSIPPYPGKCRAIRRHLGERGQGQILQCIKCWNVWWTRWNTLEYNKITFWIVKLLNLHFIFWIIVVFWSLWVILGLCFSSSSVQKPCAGQRHKTDFALLISPKADMQNCPCELRFADG